MYGRTRCKGKIYPFCSIHKKEFKLKNKIANPSHKRFEIESFAAYFLNNIWVEGFSTEDSIYCYKLKKNISRNQWINLIDYLVTTKQLFPNIVHKNNNGSYKIVYNKSPNVNFLEVDTSSRIRLNNSIIYI